MSHPKVCETNHDLYRGGYVHFSVSVGNKENVVTKTRELTDDGYECISGPRMTGDGYFESCIIGPEGILIAHYEPLFLEHYTHSYHFPGGHTPTEEEVRAWYIPMAERLLLIN